MLVERLQLSRLPLATAHLHRHLVLSNSRHTAHQLHRMERLRLATEPPRLAMERLRPVTARPGTDSPLPRTPMRSASSLDR
jgi:hypothetical protein